MSTEILREKDFKDAPIEAASIVVKFTNFSDEDFTHTFNKRPWTFKTGSVKFMERPIAEFFAKHLVNRELLKRGRENDTSPKKPSENPFFMELFNKCIESVNGIDNADQTQAEQDIIDRNMKEKLGINDKETGPKPEFEFSTIEESPKKDKKLSKNKKEEEFEEIEVPKDDSDE